LRGLVDHPIHAFKAAPRATRRRVRDRSTFAEVALSLHRAYADGRLERGSTLPVRLKKLVGTVLLVTLVIVYALVATTVAVHRLGEAGPLAHLAFFFLTGILWVVPAMAIIRWLLLSPSAPGQR